MGCQNDLCFAVVDYIQQSTHLPPSRQWQRYGYRSDIQASEERNEKFHSGRKDKQDRLLEDLLGDQLAGKGFYS